MRSIEFGVNVRTYRSFDVPDDFDMSGTDDEVYERVLTAGYVGTDNTDYENTYDDVDSEFRQTHLFEDDE